jgi:hypothetical protein
MREEADDFDAPRKLYERKVRWIRAYTALGWPVALGTHANGQGCSCQRDDCATPGWHPVSRSTTKAGWLANLLLYHPEANLLVAAGSVVTAIEVPAQVNGVALRRLPTPVAETRRRTLLFLTAGGSLGISTRLRCYTYGSYIPLPPSQLVLGREMRWVRMPFHYTLFDPGAVIDEWERWQ